MSEAILFVLLMMICVLLYGVLWTLDKIHGQLIQLTRILQAPHNLSQLTEIEIPVICATLNDLTQALAEHWHFNMNYRKN